MAREAEVMPKTIDRIQKSQRFEPHTGQPGITGGRLYRFRRRGEMIEGEMGYPIKNYHEATSYPVRLDSGEVIEILGNKLLHAQIRKGDLVGSYVRIQFVGREYLWAGHYRKVYRVWKVERKPLIPKKVWKKLYEALKADGKDVGKIVKQIKKG